ncbi:hypothetical protein AciX8_4390 [Granulicella mallensis MP5ACTX8]|uniref:Uncharacterized protein n=1 Tax=Granulicella mallensis (strain ATCC BAA-1857 / DSM 23137 / MP5ACTX8) TaxID=682795 RepID=G8NU28_GRAMM|nr:hypothetical protein AciX8_4390 [Granulicella mallensis MP5ACTX8]
MQRRKPGIQFNPPFKETSKNLFREITRWYRACFAYALSAKGALYQSPGCNPGLGSYWNAERCKRDLSCHYR